MKKIKQIALGVLGAGLLITGLFACSSEENTNIVEEDIKSINQQNKGIDDFKVGKINSDSTVEFTIDVELLKSEILKYDIVAEIENVEINNTYLTVIGKDIEDFSLVYFQAKLIKDGNSLYFPNPENSDLMTTFNSNTCAGSNCTGCSFQKDDKGKITGCNCSGTGDPSGGKVGYCNHTVTDEGVQSKIQKWLDLFIKALGLVKLK